MPRLTTRGRATAEAIRDRFTFTTSGALYAENGPAFPGRLPDEYRTKLREDENASRTAGDLFLYIVYSYSTPIAWYSSLTGTWTIPPVKYSPTTSKHQGNLYLVK